MNQFAKYNKIKFQPESWERYGHDGLDNRKSDCNIELYRITYDFSMKDLEIIQHTFGITTGYYLYDKIYETVDRKDINCVLSRTSPKGHSVWMCWCEKSQISEMSKIIIESATKKRQRLIDEHKAELDKYNAIVIPSGSARNAERLS